VEEDIDEENKEKLRQWQTNPFAAGQLKYFLEAADSDVSNKWGMQKEKHPGSRVIFFDIEFHSGRASKHISQLKKQ